MKERVQSWAERLGDEALGSSASTSVDQKQRTAGVLIDESDPAL